jgi:hypothetical protein
MQSHSFNCFSRDNISLSTQKEEGLLNNAFVNKKAKPSVFQVLLLDNNESQDVEVQESGQVDFFHVKEHLKNGGSVFITSRASQKMRHPKTKAQQNYGKSRKNCGVLFRQRLRSS